MSTYLCSETSCKERCHIVSYNEKRPPLQCPFSEVIDRVYFTKIEDTPQNTIETGDTAHNISMVGEAPQIGEAPTTPGERIINVITAKLSAV